MKISKKSIIILTLLVVCIIIFMLMFIQLNNNNSFFGVYEVTDKAFLFTDVDYKALNLLPESIGKEFVPKQRYFIEKDNFNKLFHMPDSPFAFRVANKYDKYLTLENPQYTYKDIKTLTEEEIKNDRFLSGYIKSVKPINEIKKGILFIANEKGYENFEQHIYFIDNTYYSYDEIYAFVLQKIK